MHNFGIVIFQIRFANIFFKPDLKSKSFYYFFYTFFKLDLESALVVFVMLIRIRIRVQNMVSLKNRWNSNF